MVVSEFHIILAYNIVRVATKSLQWDINYLEKDVVEKNCVELCKVLIEKKQELGHEMCISKSNNMHREKYGCPHLKAIQKSRWVNSIRLMKP